MARLDSGDFPMLDKEILSQLELQNIITVYDFLQNKNDALMKFTNLDFKEIIKIKDEIFKKFGGQWIEASDLFELQEATLSTGVKKLDELLKGGLHFSEIYEICGSSSSGKSQLCHFISTHCSLNNEATVHYIDSSRKFSSLRIQKILESKNANNTQIGQVMTNIKVHQISKVNDLFTVLHKLKLVKIKTEKKLIIIDCLATFFSQIINNYVQYHSYLSNLVAIFRFLVSQQKTVIIIVNNVIQSGDFSNSNNLDNLLASSKTDAPALGKYWLGIPNTRLFIEHIKPLSNEQRDITVWKSSSTEIGKKCTVAINDGGFF